MVTLHRFVDRHPWAVMCADCRDAWFAKALPHDYATGPRWVVYDERAIEVVRTGRLARHLTRRVVLRKEHVGWVGDQLGLSLAVAAHHHARGQVYDLTDDTWAKVTLLTLNDDRGPGLPSGVVDAACLILGED